MLFYYILSIITYGNIYANIIALRGGNMKPTVLVDNNVYIDHYYLGEPALSFYIEDEEEKNFLIRDSVMFL